MRTQVTHELREAAVKTARDQGLEPEEAPMPQIHGSCFIHMLQITPAAILDGTGNFLTKKCSTSREMLAFEILYQCFVTPVF